MTLYHDLKIESWRVLQPFVNDHYVILLYLTILYVIYLPFEKSPLYIE